MFIRAGRLWRTWWRSLLAALCAVGWVGVADAQSTGYAVRFYGNGTNDIDRVKIAVDNPSSLNDEPGPPVDVGATDFTIEFWVKASPTDNAARSIACGAGQFSWIAGNIVLDRDRFSAGGRDFGVSIANSGRLAFGVENGTGQSHTLCGSAMLLDNAWHHVAVQRRVIDGFLWMYVDGGLDAQAAGPAGDVSYPGHVYPDSNCGGPCVTSDPFIVIGAEKHDYDRANFPSYSGLFDELRISRTLRYAAPFTRPTVPFTPDATTVGLYHFNDGPGAPMAVDAATVPGSPTHGQVKYGGTPAGPTWSTDTPFTIGPPAPPTGVRIVR
ncbi:MAG: LamG domain-containing protein [Vicinamibacterales bacterium]